MSPPPRARLRRSARRVVGGFFRALGYELVRRTYYSPVPDPGSLPDDIWTRESELPGVPIDLDAGLEFVRSELADHLAEYRPPVEPTGDPRRFHLENGFYESVDAETLYAMVRRFAPERIVELGSGSSTLVIADARERNGGADRSGHVVFDPHPQPRLEQTLRSIAELRKVSATEVPLDELTSLGPGDMLFVDTSHTVRIGGEVTRILLEVLPRMAPGVIVHIHDIYFPVEYPRELVVERRFFWGEQYLIQAFLAFNEAFETLFSAHALAWLHPDELAELVPSFRPGMRPSALWLRRTA